ncbi:hypothetical protein BP6252_04476 [Coleophoma cylindrospora]|uniref:CENP-V/GFA domain-containing protein n=1 Tax=Coleophoma cylindrospora TaxID=1849047 RepID=A0A3D8S0P3_9HELO|nr:hypothetical protein BP6252_04476 [Coleophoma cylindrospora]
MSEESTPIRASCHCGAIAVIVPRVPEHINHCQCTICRRYGAAWGYYHPDEVKIETKPNAVTKQYIWGDREISFNFCDTCGCVLYWWPLQAPSTDGEEYKMGLNTSNVNPEVLRSVLQNAAIDKPTTSKDSTPEPVATQDLDRNFD